MSVAIMSRVWADARCRTHPEMLMLLALADWANDDGIAWPSLPKLAAKARIATRSARRLMRRCVADGKLVDLGAHPDPRYQGVRVYRFQLDRLATLPLEPRTRRPGMPRVTPDTASGGSPGQAVSAPPRTRRPDPPGQAMSANPSGAIRQEAAAAADEDPRLAAAAAAGAYLRDREGRDIRSEWLAAMEGLTADDVARLMRRRRRNGTRIRMPSAFVEARDAETAEREREREDAAARAGEARLVPIGAPVAPPAPRALSDAEQQAMRDLPALVAEADRLGLGDTLNLTLRRALVHARTAILGGQPLAPLHLTILRGAIRAHRPTAPEAP